MARKAKFAREDVELLVMRAARKLFSELGFESVRMQDVAEATGVNKRVLYELFSDKERLYLAVLSDVSREFASVYETWLKRCEFMTVADLYSGAFELVLDHRELTRLLACEWLNETIQGMRLLATYQVFRESARKIAAEMEPGVEPKIKEYEILFEALIGRSSLACASPNHGLDEIRALGKKLFQLI